MLQYLQKSVDITNFQQCATLATPFTISYLTGYKISFTDKMMTFLSHCWGTTFCTQQQKMYNDHLNIILNETHTSSFLLTRYMWHSLHSIDQRRHLSNLTGKYEGFITHNLKNLKKHCPEIESTYWSNIQWWKHCVVHLSSISRGQLSLHANNFIWKKTSTC